MYSRTICPNPNPDDRPAGQKLWFDQRKAGQLCDASSASCFDAGFGALCPYCTPFPESRWDS
jgi:hypothetical protein